MATYHATEDGDRRRVILLIDDDPAVVNLTSRLLEWLGYRVEAHSDALAAAQIFRKRARAYDMVIIDLLLPGLHGSWLAKRVHRLNPRLPILFYANKYTESVRNEMKQIGVVGYVKKPVGLDALANVVAQALAEGQPASEPEPVG